MGLSSSKTKTKTSQTTTPTVTEPYNSAFSGFTGQIGDFLDMDPTQFVAPPSQLQTQAFGDAQNLGGWQTYLNQATDYANQYAAHPTTQVSAVGYQAPDVPDANQFGGAQLGQASTFGGAQLGPASTVNLQGYDNPQLGDAALANSQGLLGDPKRILQYMQDYQNPYTSQVIDASLAKFDEDAGRREAALSAQGAQTGAFGGSRFGIAEGTLQGSLNRERADLQARLLDEQYKTAAGLAGSDASAANQFGLQQGQMGLQTALANQGAQNQFELSRYGAGIDAARYGADVANQGQLANQGALNNFMLQQGLLDQQTGQMNMDAMNQFALQQGLLDQQTGQFNTTALNQFLQTQVGLDADSAKYYADAMNQANFANANLTEQDYQRELQAAGMLGDLGQQYGQQSLADLGMTADLGAQQRSLEADYLNAYPTQLQLAGNLYSQLSPALYSGSNMAGTTTSKTSGMGSWLPQLAGSALQAAAQIKF